MTQTTIVSDSYVGFWRRVSATVIDAIALAVPFAVLEVLTLDVLALWLLAWAMGIAAYWWLLATRGWTPGSRVMGYAWRNANGATVGFGRALLRLIADGIPGAITFLVYILSMLTAALTLSVWDEFWAFIIISAISVLLVPVVALMTLVTIRLPRRQSLIDLTVGMRAHRVARPSADTIQ